MEKERFFKLCEVILANRHKAEMMDKLGEVTVTTEPGDKAGFDCKVYSVNGVEVRREYISNGSAEGLSAETAFAFEEGMAVTPNTYYSHDGKVYVYMGVATESADWDSVSEMMAEWYNEE